MNRILAACALVLAFTVPAYAEDERESGIRIYGIDWSQEPLRETLEMMGYTCKRNTLSARANAFECRNNEKVIKINDEEITFYCQGQGFGFCNYSFQEVAQGLVNSGVISELNYDSDYETFSDITKSSYCGPGPLGDRLCVERFTTSWGLDKTQITIYKANFGSGGLNFQ